MIDIAPIKPEDRDWLIQSITAAFGERNIARKSELIDASTLDGLIARNDGEEIGHVTWREDETGLEVVSIVTETGLGRRQVKGAGQALMQAALDEAKHRGARRLWLVTTNDNIPAIHFYQKWGMTIHTVYIGASETARGLKPSLPQEGFDGLPIRDEIEFELVLSGDQ